MVAGYQMRLMSIAALLVLTTPTLATARTWHVPGDAPTIQGGIDLASAGDDVLVAPGTYPEYDIVMKAGVWVHTEQGPGATTVDATASGTGFVCADLDPAATIEGFTILNGHAQGPEDVDESGGGVRCVHSSVVIRGCIITGCVADRYGGGVYAYYSDVDIEECRVTECDSDRDGGGILTIGSTTTIVDCEVLDNVAGDSCGGIRASGPEVTIVRCVASGNTAGWGGAGGIGCTSSALLIRDCLITGNTSVVFMSANGLGISSSSGLVEGCTVAANFSGPGSTAVEIGYSDIELGRLVIAFNDGMGLYCDTYQSDIRIRCCDVYGNTESDDLCGTDLGGNFSLDPLFCDAPNGDYTLDGCSPCLPGNHPHGVDCGLIGALGQGCGATAIEETSWGRMKSLYRR